MIRKIIKVKNIGQFRDFKASGDITFGKITLIYGENSAGKTTLVSILRSLVENNPSIITERKSFGLSEDQLVEILLEENKIINFINNRWKELNEDLRNVEIYDEFFVNENVFTGLEIHAEHQKNLCGFALGKEGFSLAKEIESIKEELNQKKHPERSRLRSQIKILIESLYSVEDFINLTKDEVIDQRIKEKNEELNVAKKVKEIGQKDYLEEIPNLRVPMNFELLKNLLLKSLESISNDALEKTIEHIDRLKDVIKKDSELWLYQGLNYVENKKDNICPFCQQDLKEAKDTVNAYNQYFSEEYRELKRSIDDQLQEIRNINIERIISDIEKCFLNNNTLCEFWKTFLPSIEIPILQGVDQFKKESITLFDSIKKLIEKKAMSILQSVHVSEINDFLDFIEVLNIKHFQAYNAKIKHLNKRINKLKTSEKSDIDNLMNDLKKLEIQKKRYSSEVNSLCKNYKRYEEEIVALNKNKDKKTEELNESMSQKIEKYIEETNKVLKKFGVNFKIIKPKTRYKGRGEEPYLEYFLEMDGFPINPLQQTKFTLSGGDKNALALSFSLAKLNVDNDTNKKIVIFDDPITSLDINRKRRTIEAIKGLANKAKQVLIFTHYNNFAFELYDSFHDLGIKPKCLQICNGAIREWDLCEDKKHPYFKNLTKLEEFLSSDIKENKDEVRRLIRNCLEDKLKFGYFHFFDELGEDCCLGDIVKKLRCIKDDNKLRFKNPNKEEVIDELGNLCDFSDPLHHGDIRTPYNREYTKNEIINYVKSTLKLLYDWL
jgi:wobble nucleotide-excising tRNase